MRKELAVSHSTHQISFKDRQVIAKEEPALKVRSQVCSSCNGNGRLEHCRECAEPCMVLPLGKVVGIVGVLCFSPHASFSEIRLVLAVVTYPCMIVEIVFVVIEVDFTVLIPHTLGNVVVFPTQSQFTVKVHCIQREYFGIGLLVDVRKVVAIMSALVEILVYVMPELIAESHLLELPRLDVELQPQH